MISETQTTSLRLLGCLFLLAGPKLGDLDLNGLVDTLLELGSVPDHEEKLEPDKQRGEEDGLEQVVEQGGRPPLELAVADELGQPAHDVDGDGDLGDWRRALQAEVVGQGGGAKADQGQHRPCYRFKQHIERTPEQGGEGS